MPNRARNLKLVSARTTARSPATVRCSVCERRIETRGEKTEEMIRCPHCGTLQHRVGKKLKKRRRSK